MGWTRARASATQCEVECETVSEEEGQLKSESTRRGMTDGFRHSRPLLHLLKLNAALEQLLFDLARVGCDDRVYAKGESWANLV